MAADLIPGTLFSDRYRVRQKLGEGGFGAVFLVEDTRPDEDSPPIVALKILDKPSHDTEDEFEARVKREIKNARRLQNPHVVRVLDAGRTPDHVLYYTMEFCQGRALRQIIKDDGALLPPRAVRLAAQVLEGLEAAHAIEMIHRDIKPANVIVQQHPDGREQAKLLDFGLAKVLSGTQSQELTRAGTISGTIEYMAPEQLRGSQLDARADLYSIGVMLYEMLAGARPFDRPSAQLTARAHLLEPPPPLAGRAPFPIPPDLNASIFCALEKDRNKRFASAREMRDTLLHAVPEARDPYAGAPRRPRASGGGGGSGAAPVEATVIWRPAGTTAAPGPGGAGGAGSGPGAGAAGGTPVGSSGAQTMVRPAAGAPPQRPPGHPPESTPPSVPRMTGTSSPSMPSAGSLDASSMPTAALPASALAAAMASHTGSRPVTAAGFPSAAGGPPAGPATPSQPFPIAAPGAATVTASAGGQVPTRRHSPLAGPLPAPDVPPEATCGECGDPIGSAAAAAGAAAGARHTRAPFRCAGCGRLLCSVHYDSQVGLCFKCGSDDRRGFTCAACGTMPAAEPFDCRLCGRTHCGAHFTAAAGTCGTCAPARMSSSAVPALQASSSGASAVARAGVQPGRAAPPCPICGRDSGASSFACDACERIVCGGHREAPLDLCQPCASAIGPVPGVAPGGLVARRYRVLGIAHRGEKSRIYNARDLATGIPVALKVLEAEAASSEKARQRFIRGAYALRRIVHRHVVQIRAAGILEDKVPFLALDWFPGVPASSLLATTGAFAPGRACAIVDQLLAGLAAVHAAAVVHRNVKPRNILLQLTDGGEVGKIVDFGLAKTVDGDEPAVTSMGATVGTVAYMPPEQLRGQTLDGRADLYAAGITLYEMLTGHVPFYADDRMQLARLIMGQPVPALPEDVPAPPRPALAQILARALAKTADQRFRDISEMRAALRPLLPPGYRPA